jgi:hypothetical protein
MRAASKDLERIWFDKRDELVALRSDLLDDHNSQLAKAITVEAANVALLQLAVKRRDCEHAAPPLAGKMGVAAGLEARPIRHTKIDGTAEMRPS